MDAVRHPGVSGAGDHSVQGTRQGGRLVGAGSVSTGVRRSTCRRSDQSAHSSRCCSYCILASPFPVLCFVGVLIFEMLAGYPPFYDENPFGIYQKILKGVIDFPRHMDPLAKDLIKKLLTADRTKRFGCLHAGAEDIKSAWTAHRWRASAGDHNQDGWLMLTCVCSPCVRVVRGCDRTHKWFSKVDWVALFNRTIKPPFVPAFRAPNDTSNFDRYPDSREGAAATQTQLNEKEKLLFADF